MRVGNPGDEIGRARAAAGHADGGPAPQAAEGVGHHRRRLLMADVDHPDLVLVARVLAVDHGAAHKKEDHVDPVILEAARQDLVAGHITPCLWSSASSSSRNSSSSVYTSRLC